MHPEYSHATEAIERSEAVARAMEGAIQQHMERGEFTLASMWLSMLTRQKRKIRRQKWTRFLRSLFRGGE